MKHFLIGALCSFFVFSVQAKSYTPERVFRQIQSEYPNLNLGSHLFKIAEVTDNYRDGKVTWLMLLTDQNDDPTYVVGFDPTPFRVNTIDDDADALEWNKQFYEIEKMNDEVQVVRKSERKIIGLKSEFTVTRDQPTPIQMNYLYKGKIFGEDEYRHHNFLLYRSAKGWQLQELNGAPVNHIHFVVRKRLGIVIGIKEVHLR